jgi:hypothetical protein
MPLNSFSIQVNQILENASFNMTDLELLMEEAIGVIGRPGGQARKRNGVLPPVSNLQHELVQQMSEWLDATFE